MSVSILSSSLYSCFNATFVPVPCVPTSCHSSIRHCFLTHEFGTVLYCTALYCTVLHCTALYLPQPVCHISVTIVMSGRLLILRPNSSLSREHRWKASSVTKLRAIRAGIHRLPAPPPTSPKSGIPLLLQKSSLSVFPI
jgi:hypothetical protein